MKIIRLVSKTGKISEYEFNLGDIPGIFKEAIERFKKDWGNEEEVRFIVVRQA